MISWRHWPVYDIGSCLLVPDVMLKEGEGVFLDDVSLDELERRIGCPVIVFDSTPGGCYKALRSIWEEAAEVTWKSLPAAGVDVALKQKRELPSGAPSSVSMFSDSLLDGKDYY